LLLLFTALCFHLFLPGHRIALRGGFIFPVWMFTCDRTSAPPHQHLVRAALRHSIPTVFHDLSEHTTSKTRAPCQFAIILSRGTPRPRLARVVSAGRYPSLLHRRRRCWRECPRHHLTPTPTPAHSLTA
jgi:hypothetical protein